MKRFLSAIALICLLVGTSIDSEAQVFPKTDASIMDMAYFPAGSPFFYFAQNDEQKKARTKKMRVIYSRPAVKGRKVFGETKDDPKEFLVPYGNFWRAGANESTELLLFTDVKVGGKTLKAGQRYTIHIKPTAKEWTIYFSSELDGWGSYSFQNAPDKTTVATVSVPTESTAPFNLELVSMFFEESDKGANLVIGWDNTMVKVPFEL